MFGNKEEDQKPSPPPVRFSENSESYENNSEHIVEPSELWITASDTERIKREQLDEIPVILHTREVITAASELGIYVPLTEEELARSIGMEHSLSPKKAMDLRYRREQHLHTIVSKQEACTPEALSHIAMRSSKQDSIHAQKLAISYGDKFQQGLYLGFQMKLIEALTCLQI